MGLKLKGAPPRNLKKTKSKIEEAHKAEKVPVSVVEQEEEPEGWVLVESLEDLSGPLVLCTMDGHIVCVDEAGKPSLEKLEGNFDSFEPDQVPQVLVGRNLLPGVFCLKSAYSRYLSSDPLGKVSASKEAVGPSEKWNPQYLGEGLVAFKGPTGHFLASSDTFGLRADSPFLGESEKFMVKCQAAERWNRQRAERQQAEKAKAKPSDDLEDLRRQHMFIPSGHPRHDRAVLEKAQKEGNLRETLLDQRTKAKHDKFC